MTLRNYHHRIKSRISNIGKDHMQIQVIPIAAERLSSSIQTFMQTYIAFQGYYKPRDDKQPSR